jgi:nucleotide-binding universal stress UspA family protein
MSSTPPLSEGAVPKTIIVPLDGSPFSEGAVPIAHEIAGRVGAHVVLMATHFDDADMERRMKYLAGVADRVDRDSIGLISINEHPNALVIEELIHDDPDRIVCMRSHGYGRVRWAVLGSVAERVVRESRRPMLLVGRHCAESSPSDTRHMLVCVDGSTNADPVVPVAIAWAKALGLDVQVARVVHPFAFGDRDSSDEVIDAIAARFVADGLEAVPVILHGSHVAGAIADYVTDSQIALVAMNTHARGGISRATLGSVAMATVGLVECPVLLAPMAERQG